MYSRLRPLTAPHPEKDMTPTKPFDAADFLDSEEAIQEYLAAAKEEKNPDIERIAELDAEKARTRLRKNNTGQQP